MKVRKITVADACDVTGYTRNQLRGMLRDLPMFVSHNSMPKSARTFTRNELLVICAIAEMETRYGIRRTAIGTIVRKLTESLQGPRPVNPHARLLILFQPCTVTYLAEDSHVTEGVVIPLGPIFDRVDRYLGAYSDTGVQTELPLGPVVVREKHRRTR